MRKNPADSCWRIYLRTVIYWIPWASSESWPSGILPRNLVFIACMVWLRFGQLCPLMTPWWASPPLLLHPWGRLGTKAVIHWSLPNSCLLSRWRRDRLPDPSCVMKTKGVSCRRSTWILQIAIYWQQHEWPRALTVINAWHPFALYHDHDQRMASIRTILSSTNGIYSHCVT